MLPILLACSEPLHIDPRPRVEDSADSARVAVEFAEGDPITNAGSAELNTTAELVGAAVVSEDRGLAVGGPGWIWIDLQAQEALAMGLAGNVYRVAVDGERAYLATRTEGIAPLDLGDPPTQGEHVQVGPHEGVAADGGIVLVGGLDAGMLVLDRALEPLGDLDLDRAFAVAIEGDRGAVTDGDRLLWLDLSDPAAPMVLDEVSTQAPGRDLALEGGTLALAMGEGIAIYEVAGDAIELRSVLEVPGAPLSIDLDGDWLWIAAWEVAALAWVGRGEPRVVGHEAPRASAMGIGAKDGVALLGDWEFATILRQVPDTQGPEVHLEGVDVIADEASFEVRNWGAGTLELAFEESESVELSHQELSLGAGEAVTLTAALEGDSAVELGWTSNDPDELEGALSIGPASGVLGSEHAEMELLGFLPPDDALSPYRLADYRGQVVVLVYFTTW